MRGIREGVGEELSKNFANLFNVMSAIRGPDFEAPGLKWALTAFIRWCVLADSAGDFIRSREDGMSKSTVYHLTEEVRALMRKAEEDVRVWEEGVNHYLTHADSALYVLEKCRALSEERRQEATDLRNLITSIKVRFERVRSGRETANLASMALEAAVVAWYEIYSKH